MTALAISFTIDMPVFRRYAPLKNTMDNIVVTRLKAKLMFPLKNIQTDSSNWKKDVTVVHCHVALY